MIGEIPARIRERLAERSLELPVLGPPRYAYEPAVLCGDVLHVSGQISRTAAGELLGGTLGEDATTDDGVAAARVCALNLLARMHEAVGLANVRRVVKLNAWVASSRDFVDQPTVVDGASQLLRDVLGDAGGHARTALAVHVLPQGALVEIDAVVAVRE